jgi:pentatricopeptide repeat protein
MGALRDGKQIHGEIVRRGLLGTNVMLGNALVDMYAKCGALAESQRALEGLHARNVVSWSALISGYAQQGRCREALGCFKRMQSEGLSPDEITFICILKACAGMAALDEGKEIHVRIITRDLLGENDIVLGTALVDMYAKCGAISAAKQVFEELPIRSTGSWSALMSGYAQRGQGQEALSCFRRMQGEGLSPDAITFVCLLSACGHSGLLDEAQMQFGNMSVKYGISPSLEHFTCMVMVFGYAGLFAEAMSVIRSMACSDYSSIWLALLAACKKWGNAKLGRFAFDHLILLDVSCPTAYVLMADIYASAGLLEDVEEIEAMRSENIDLKCNVTLPDIHATSANQQGDVEKIKALGSENTDLKCDVNLADDIYASAALLDDVRKIEAMGSENIDRKRDVNLADIYYASASHLDDVKKIKAVEPEISNLKHNVNILSINSSKCLLICFQLASQIYLKRSYKFGDIDLEHKVNTLSINSSQYLLIFFQLASQIDLKRSYKFGDIDLEHKVNTLSINSSKN